MIRLGITTGDPAGIGPEIVSHVLRFCRIPPDQAIIVYGQLNDPECSNWNVTPIDCAEQANNPGQIYLIPVEDSDISPGNPSQKSGEVAFRILKRCGRDLASGILQGVVTAPVSKHWIRTVQPDFIGHTEYFAHTSGTAEVVMTFWGRHFNLALLTTHRQLCRIESELTPEVIENRLRLILEKVRRIEPESSFAMLAVNPHAGENGAFGTIDLTIAEIIDRLRSEGLPIDGPFPADTFFATGFMGYGTVISAYHDQGLIPFKMMHPFSGVNITLGLPFVRTSVDHGTAFDIAGMNRADHTSMASALDFAQRLISTQWLPETETYTSFAMLYDQYMAHVGYDGWVHFVLHRFNRMRGRSPARIHELACGTANIATRLVKKGLQVDASDRSAAMLRRASTKPFAPGLFRRDMLDPMPPGHYDLVLALFDSVNYIRSDSQFTEMLDHVAESLTDDGIFIFDITTIKNCRDSFDGFINVEEYDNCFFVHGSELDQNEEMQTTHLTFFLRTGRMYERRDEFHRQRIYRTEHLIDLIRQSRLELSGIYSILRPGNMIHQDPEGLDQRYTRLFFVTEKTT